MRGGLSQALGPVAGRDNKAHARQRHQRPTARPGPAARSACRAAGEGERPGASGARFLRGGERTVARCWQRAV